MEEVKVIGVEDGALRIALCGEIDFGKAEAFYEEVMAAYKKEPQDLLFDCAGLEFIDSTTLGTFVKVLKQVKTEGKKMTLVNLQAKIKKLFVICALDRIIEIA